MPAHSARLFTQRTIPKPFDETFIMNTMCCIAMDYNGKDHIQSRTHRGLSKPKHIRCEASAYLVDEVKSQRWVVAESGAADRRSTCESKVSVRPAAGSEVLERSIDIRTNQRRSVREFSQCLCAGARRVAITRHPREPGRDVAAPMGAH